jgi:hypothetical protein
MSNIQFTSVTTEDGQQFITIFAEDKLLPPVDDSHPNFLAIKDACLASMEGAGIDVPYLVSLFDVAQTVADQFARLSDRVTVKNGVILLDNDPVHGELQDQIIQFLNAGEEFEPLVKFYEKILTNPLGDVREGLYSFIKGQRANGNFTITRDGDILGYKSVQKAVPEWRTEETTVYVPSRRGEGIVNDREVKRNEYVEQVPGDIVEMPRSRVLYAPSQACGDGLHIGTYEYAERFSGDTVMLVRFSPRDIVSMPDNNSTWKLRVCRYEVLGAVTEPLEVPVWSPEGEGTDESYTKYDEYEDYDEPDEDYDLEFEDDGEDVHVGERYQDYDDDWLTITAVNGDGTVAVRWDDIRYGDDGHADHFGIDSLKR